MSLDYFYKISATTLLAVMLVCSPALAQEDPLPVDYSAEFWDATGAVENSSIEEDNVQAVEEDDEVTAEVVALGKAKATEAADYFHGQTAIFEGEGQTEKLRTNSTAFAYQKIGTRKYEGMLPGKAAKKMSKGYENAMQKDVDEPDVLVFEDEPASGFHIDYEIESIERLLDQKLDLIDGVMTADAVEPIAVDSEYGFNQDAWTEQMASVQAQIDQPKLVKGETYWKYNSDPDREKMYTQEKKNMELLKGNIDSRDVEMEKIVNGSQEIYDMGGVAMSLDGLDQEITDKLLAVDREILDIMTEDAYEKDMALYEDDLVHPITGRPLKGYAKRKALKELGKSYGQVEAMRTKNIAGDVLSEAEILDVMMDLYDGYNPYL